MSLYTYQASAYCPRCILSEAIRVMHGNGEISTREAGPLALAALDVRHGSYSIQSLETLAGGGIARLAEIREIDLSDPYSYDSDDFPKYSPSCDEGEACASCGEDLAGDHLPRPDITAAEARGAQSALESVAAEVDEAISSRVILAEAYGFTLSAEAIRENVADVIGRALDLARDPEAEIPEARSNWAGIALI